MPARKPHKAKPIKGMRPVRWTRVTNPFAAPGDYASSADAHGPAGHHTGIDFGSHLLAPVVPIAGQPVRTVVPGEVVISDYNSTMGNWVGVYYAEDNITVTYWHMRDRMVRVGQTLKRGTIVGHVGETGNAYGAHLHLQINHGRGFDYSGHIRPWPWCHGSRWWNLFDRRKKAGRATRGVAPSYAADTRAMVSPGRRTTEEAVHHPAHYDGHRA